MLKNKLPPVIEKFTGAWSSSNWAGGGILDPATSPRSPLDLDAQSLGPNSKGLKNYQLGGIGLGIVIEMEKKSDKPKFSHNNPVQVHEEIEEDDLEDYTFVTYHGSKSPNKSYSRVYCDSRRGLVKRNNQRVATFYISSPKYEDFSQYPSPDFLKSCDLCKKQLHGKDIYMYRGEKGFCSKECRYEQIMMDQRDAKVVEF